MEKTYMLFIWLNNGKLNKAGIQRLYCTGSGWDGVPTVLQFTV